jgi:hypothetical protein
MIKDYKSALELDLENGMPLDKSGGVVCHGGGSGKSPQVAEKPIVEPVAPIREAGVSVDEEEGSEEEQAKKKLKTGKSSLKLPSISKDIGLSGSGSESGLKI